MSNPGPGLCRFATCRSPSERCRRFARSASSADPARCTRSSGRTGPGNRHCSGSRAASSLPTTGRSRSAGSSAGTALPPRRGTLGLGMAYQTYSHVLDLSVAENLYLAAPRSQQPSYGRMEEWASAKLAEFGLEVPVGAPTRRLSLANRQFLEVIKALLARPKVLLLDEPTTAFGPEDVRAAARRSCSSRAAPASASPTSATASRRCSGSPIASLSSATGSARGRSRPPRCRRRAWSR